MKYNKLLHLSFIFFFLFVAARNSMAEKKNDPNEIIALIKKGMMTEKDIDYTMLDNLRKHERGISILRELSQNSNPQIRKKTMSLIINYDNRVKIHDNKKYVSPKINNPSINNMLVDILCDPSRKDIKNYASNAVLKYVDEKTLSIRSNDIIKAAQNYNIDNINLILGCTKDPDALKLLLKNKKFKECNLKTYELALAKLGYKQYENKYIADYKNFEDSSDLVYAIKSLGYIGTEKCTEILARNMRTEKIHELPNGVKVSVRLYIIEALSQIYPNESLFHRPLFVPDTDYYYKNIEKWCEDYFNIKWDKPRPTFFYEAQVPINIQR